jgi:hypothetical protein
MKNITFAQFDFFELNNIVQSIIYHMLSLQHMH